MHCGAPVLQFGGAWRQDGCWGSTGKMTPALQHCKVGLIWLKVKVSKLSTLYFKYKSVLGTHIYGNLNHPSARKVVRFRAGKISGKTETA